MGKRAAVQGRPFALVHAYAAKTHQKPLFSYGVFKKGQLKCYFPIVIRWQGDESFSERMVSLEGRMAISCDWHKCSPTTHISSDAAITEFCHFSSRTGKIGICSCFSCNQFPVDSACDEPPQPGAKLID